MLDPRRHKKIAVLRALQLGDMLCAVPAFKSLRKALPETEIVLLGLPWASQFSKRLATLFNRFIPFSGYPGLPEQNFSFEKIVAFINQMREEKFDLVIQMQGEGSILNSLVQLFAAKETVGYYRPGYYQPNENFVPYPDGVNEVKRHLLLMEKLGCEVVDQEIEFPIFKEDESKAENLLQGDNKFVCINPGSREESKNWGVENFALVGKLLQTFGFSIVVIGSIADKKIGNEVTGLTSGRVIDLTGKTSLGTLAALLKKSSLLITNDTGTSHLAAATRTKSIVIFKATDPLRWAPINKDLHKIVLPSESRVERVLDLALKQLKLEKGEPVYETF